MRDCDAGPGCWQDCPLWLSKADLEGLPAWVRQQACPGPRQAGTEGVCWLAVGQQQGPMRCCAVVQLKAPGVQPSARCPCACHRPG